MCVVIPVAEIQTPHSVAFYSCLAVYWLNLLYLVAPGAETAPHDNRAAGSVSSLGQFFVLEAVCLSVGCKELRCKRRNITWLNESKPARLAKKRMRSPATRSDKSTQSHSFGESYRSRATECGHVQRRDKVEICLNLYSLWFEPLLPLNLSYFVPKQPNILALFIFFTL